MDGNTKLVAIGAAANSCGTVTDISAAVDMVRTASQNKAFVFIDAVHFAPHQIIDVQTLGCDFLVCSSYKFCGPHAGLMYGKKSVLELLTPYKLTACTDLLPSSLSCQSSRWETGTASFEAVAGITAAVEYLASLGVRSGDCSVSDNLRTRLIASYAAIKRHEAKIAGMFLSQAATISGLTVYGVLSDDMGQRTPTFSVTMAGVTAGQLAQHLVDRGVAAGAGHFYALQFPVRMNLTENGGFTRIGFFHYNTLEEVGRVIAALKDISLSIQQ